MQLSILALTSGEWGVARFTTDSLALISLFILIALPIILLKDKAGLKSIWSNDNAISKRQ